MTRIEVENELDLLQEGEAALLEKLGPAKATRFWIAFSEGEGDYLDIKGELFEGEDVDSLSEKITGSNPDQD